MSRELWKMNLIAIVQQLPEEDIHTVETYIKMIEQENEILQEKFSIVSEMNVENYNKYCEALKEQVVLKDRINKAIEVDRDLKDIVISALRYSVGRKTYITGQTSEFIMKHPELIDERVKKVMIKDLEEYFAYRGCYYNDDECDYESWLRLYEWLGGLK